MKSRILLILFLLLPMWCHGRMFYVSNDGSDINPGTIERPFRSINRGMTLVGPGDTILVREGIYHEVVVCRISGSSERPISLLAFPGERPVIDGMNDLPLRAWDALLTLDAEYVHVSGFEIRNSNMSGKVRGGVGISIERAHNRISHMDVHHCSEHGVVANGDYSIIEFCRIWDTCLSNKDGRLGVGWGAGISVGGCHEDGITEHAIIRGNTVRDTWGEGICTFESRGTIMEDNVSFDNWSGNLYLCDAQEVLVQRNIIFNTEYNPESGIDLADEGVDSPRSANQTIINNFIYNCNLNAFRWTMIPGSGLDDVLIAHNTIVMGKLVIGAFEEDGIVTKSGRVINNIFYNGSASPAEVVGSLENIDFSNNAWSTAPPQGVRSKEDFIGDPDFLSNSGLSETGLSPDFFKLNAASPLIDAGSSQVIIGSDFFKQDRDAHPDPGGHEIEKFVP